VKRGVGLGEGEVVEVLVVLAAQPANSKTAVRMTWAGFLD
jgi:hypothetical protein